MVDISFQKLVEFELLGPFSLTALERKHRLGDSVETQNARIGNLLRFFRDFSLFLCRDHYSGRQTGSLS